MWQVPYSYGSQSSGSGSAAASQRVVVRFSVLHFNKAIKWTAFPLLVCGLTLRYHKPINSKAAIYGGVMGKNDRMFVHKVLHAIALTTIALNSVAEDSCTKDKAFEIAMEHLRLNQMYLEKYEPYKLFESSASDATWAVFGVGGVPKGMLGGGSPTVIISSESCEVEKAYYAR